MVLMFFSRLSALASLYNFSQSRKEKIETGVILHCLTRARGCSYTTVIPLSRERQGRGWRLSENIFFRQVAKRNGKGYFDIMLCVT